MKRRRINIFENKFIWIINMITYNLSKVIPKKKNKWVIGCWLGDKYADNSKYFYEYIIANTDIDIYWITNNINVYEYLTSKNNKVLMSGSFKAFITKLTASAAIYTNSLYDLGNLNVLGGAYKVALWHGMPLKRLYCDEKDFRCGGIKERIKTIKMKIYSDVTRDMTISTSESCSRNFATCFMTDIKTIFLTGQPRNDVFLKNIDRNNVLGETGDKRIILYMPTYRTNDVCAKKYDKLLSELVSSKKMSEILDESNSILLVKLHYLVQKPNLSTNNIKFLDDSEVKDTQELLAISDMLITDYSSCFIDFLLMKKPVIFLENDINEYVESENGVYYDYHYITKGLLAEDISSFEKILSKALANIGEHVEKQNELKTLFNNPEIGENYSENVYNTIISNL